MWFRALLLILAIAVGVTALQRAKDCSTATTPCDMPCCRCISNEIPHNFTTKEIPQFVLLTFDDEVTVTNINLFKDLESTFSNPNGCPIALTLFLTHEFNDYALTYKLWKAGHEIAVSSLSQKADVGYWKHLSTEGWKNELGGMKKLLEKYAKIPPDDILGVRAPFLQPGGDNQFQGMAEADLYWDYSMSSRNRVDLWPFSLDYRSNMDCMVPPCPQSSFPNMWVIPILDLFYTQASTGLEQPCATIDGCRDADTEDEVYNLLMKNFNRNYGGNRAPFGVHTQSAWFTNFAMGDGRLKGYRKFIKELLNYDDVYFVTVSQALDWMQNPQPVNHYKLNTFRVCDSRRRLNTNRCRVTYKCIYQANSVEHNMNICGLPSDCPTSPIIPGGII